jgi:hypothetical protein
MGVKSMMADVSKMAPRMVDISNGVTGATDTREMPTVSLGLDMDKITSRLKEDFLSSFNHAALTTDMFAEMIGYGVVRVLEEMAAQGAARGAKMIMVPAPTPKEALEPPEGGNDVWD